MRRLRQKKMLWKSSVIGIHAPPGQLSFENKVTRQERPSSARAECFALKAIEKRFQHGELGSRDHDRAFAPVAIGNLMTLAKIAKTIEMAEKIKRPVFFRRGRRKDSAPNARGVASRTGSRFSSASVSSRPTARTSEPKSSGSISSKYNYCSSDVSGGNCFVNSGDRFRTSSQSKKASGVSSQIANRRYLFLLVPLFGVHFVVARDHFGRGDVQAHAPTRGHVLPRRAGLPRRIFRRFRRDGPGTFPLHRAWEMQQVGEFLFVSSLRVGSARQEAHTHTHAFQHTDGIVGRRLSARAEMRRRVDGESARSPRVCGVSSRARAPARGSALSLLLIHQSPAPRGGLRSVLSSMIHLFRSRISWRRISAERCR